MIKSTATRQALFSFLTRTRAVFRAVKTRKTPVLPPLTHTRVFLGSRKRRKSAVFQFVDGVYNLRPCLVYP